MPIIRRHAHPPVNTGLGAYFAPRRDFSTEVYARELTLEMREGQIGGVSFAPSAWSMFDPRSSFEYIPTPTGIDTMALGPEGVTPGG